MPGDLLPGLALVAAGEDRAGVRAEVHAGRVLPVPAHALAQHREEACLLGEPGTLRFPGRTGVPGAPYGCGRVRRVAAHGVAVERHGPDRALVAGVCPEREAEGGRQARGDVVPGMTAVGRPPYAVVVLLVERIAGGALDVVHAEAGVSLGGGCRVDVALAV